jgi:nitrate/TMAO reductase-like tetraheme cytochrome c subunit
VPRLSFEGFRDPVKRPRLIIWVGVVLIILTGVWLIAIAMFAAVAMSVTSTRWFCAASACHKIQADALAGYENSSHSEISCLACHNAVDSNTVVFLIHKVEVGVAGIVGVVGGTELPLNAESEVAMNAKVMPEGQCTQCHTKNRTITPSPGIIIDHAVHSAKGITCTQCHNRIAHDEKGLTLTKGSHPHEDFMKMEGCFRCHDLEKKKQAPGDCGLCHPAGFELKPGNHFEKGFFQLYGDSAGHAKLAKADTKNTYCGMCHVKAKFCEGCHGVPIPHPAGFTKTHGPAGKSNPASCAKCHAKGAANANGLQFCNACHHKQGDPTKPWIPQHVKVVGEVGANSCFECHSPTFCANCHVRGPK